MRCEKDIPRFMQIGRFRCKVWYRGQPIICDICCKDGHNAGTCPDKGKCRLCHQIGHMARECPSWCSQYGGEHTTLSCNRTWGSVITAPTPAPVAPAVVSEEFPDCYLCSSAGWRIAWGCSFFLFFFLFFGFWCQFEGQSAGWAWFPKWGSLGKPVHPPKWL